MRIALLLGWLAWVIPLIGCSHHRHEPEGRHIRVNAPYADVDVFVPDDHHHDIDVDVDVDD